MKKKTLTRLPLLLCLLGCSHTSNFVSDSQEKGVTITDLVGRINQIKEENRKRVLCIGAGALRRYSYIGDRENLVAAEDIDRNIGANVFEDVSRPYYDIHKEYLSTLPSCGKGGPQAQSAEAEKILACNPSLIISEYEDVAPTENEVVDYWLSKEGYNPNNISYMITNDAPEIYDGNTQNVIDIPL